MSVMMGSRIVHETAVNTEQTDDKWIEIFHFPNLPNAKQRRNNFICGLVNPLIVTSSKAMMFIILNMLSFSVKLHL
ncbi:Hypothetical predicted protein [Octopus vulgaris]|uniref:Uncharacterized protein n=1 Tax=Octopus vulgaris TaxID=6645 RepID=A0AA36BK26_OCTVU|nr:Hypothetical predicted protein [Octopus vulgaris]